MIISYFCSFVLAHGIDMYASSGICLLIVLALFMLGLLIFRKDARIPKGLFVSTIIPFILVLISILIFSFGLWVPDVVKNPCFMAIWYPNLLIMGAFGMGVGFFTSAFIMDTLIIFAILRMIIYIRSKLLFKKPFLDKTNYN